MSLSTTISSLLLPAAILVPLIFAFLLAVPRLRSRVQALAPLAAAPALVLAIMGQTGTSVESPWLFKQTSLAMDETARVFLGFTSILYIAATWRALSYMRRDERRTRFFAFLLVSMAGNMGVILAADIPNFYLGFAMMGLASAGLVFHRGDPESFRAGRLYLILAMAGEAMLFAGLTILAARAGTTAIGDLTRSAHTTLTLILVTAGFGIKAGALTLHFWLPLAHPAAPVPASAVLSGAMIKAGLLGWLRFLPLGVETLPTAGTAWVAVGLAAAFFGAAAGACRSNPKTVLAYSSISQMGIMMTGVGAGLVEPEAWSVILPALLIYAAHHGLAKGALFLGVGPTCSLANRAGVFWARWSLLLPALALAGAPFTSGALAKTALKKNLDVLPAPWDTAAGWLLPLAAAGTTLLMIRFLVLTWPRREECMETESSGDWKPQVFAVVATVTGIWLLPGSLDWLMLKLEPLMLWKAVWPLLFGSALAWFLHRRLEKRKAHRTMEPLAMIRKALFGLLRVPAGAERKLRGKEKAAKKDVQRGREPAAGFDVFAVRLTAAENVLRSWPVVGFILVLISAVLIALVRRAS